jgi:hypothetical protein
VAVDVSIAELGAREQAGTSDQNGQLVTQNSSPEAKIELFRSLFRGRTDVFPVRFESQRTGKGGYSPAWSVVLKLVSALMIVYFLIRIHCPKEGSEMITLPLQKKAREQGNTSFIDEQFKPYTDQWSLLAGLRRISQAQVETLVRDAETKGRVIGVSMALTDEENDRPWRMPPSRRCQLPILEPVTESLELILADQIYIRRWSCP